MAMTVDEAIRSIRQLVPVNPVLPTVVDPAMPDFPLGHHKNPIIYPGQTAPSSADILKVGPRRWRTLFLGQYVDGRHDLAYYASNLGRWNKQDNELFGIGALFDTFELPAWGALVNVFDIQSDPEKGYLAQKTLTDAGLERSQAISNHLAGEFLLTPDWYLYGRQNIYGGLASNYLIGPTHKKQDWLDKKLTIADMKAVKQRAKEELIATIDAAANSDIKIVNGFIGSNMWDLLYWFPNPGSREIQSLMEEGAKELMPVLEHAAKRGVVYCLEVHPREQAYSLHTTKALIKALLKINPDVTRKAFRVNYDASHMHKQGIDQEEFLGELGPESDLGPALGTPLDPSDNLIAEPWVGHHHVKGAVRTDNRRSSQLGDMINFGRQEKRNDFTSPHANDRGVGINFPAYMHILNQIGYTGNSKHRPHVDSVEWEQFGLDPIAGAILSARALRGWQEHATGSSVAFDAWA